MAKAIEQRLTALEQHQAEKLARMDYEQLIAYIKAGLLKEADFERLTDEQLWWIVAGREEPLPGESEWPKR